MVTASWGLKTSRIAESDFKLRSFEDLRANACRLLGDGFPGIVGVRLVLKEFQVHRGDPKFFGPSREYANWICSGYPARRIWPYKPGMA